MAATVEEIAEFLAKVPLFKPLKMSQLEKLAQRVRERDYVAGDVIVEQGVIGIGLFIVAHGPVKVIRIHADGNQRELDTLDRFDFFGELSLLEDAVRTASVIADGDCKCLVLSKLDFLDELDDDPAMAVPMLKEIASRFRRILATL